MFDAPNFCYLWIKSMEISIDILIIHLSKYSYKKFLFSLSLIVIHGQLKHL